MYDMTVYRVNKFRTAYHIVKFNWAPAKPEFQRDFFWSTLSPITNNMGSPIKEQAVSSAGYKVQALDRAFAVLDQLASGRTPQSLAEISESLQLHKSTVHRFLMVLEHHRMIERTGRGKFRLGLRLLEYSTHVLEQHDLRETAEPHLRRLVAEVEETAHLCVMDQDQIVYLNKIEPSRSIRMISRVGSTSPIHCTAAGRAMLAAYAPDTVKERLKRVTLRQFTAKTIRTHEELLKEIDRTRRRGFGIDDGEREEGVRCLGVAILAPDRLPIAAISISGPPFRITKQKVPEIVQRLQHCARAIQRESGYAFRGIDSHSHREWR
jgi:DNA-binding IclR family transcriptional regulator